MDAITAARKLVYTHFNRRCAFLRFLLFDSSPVKSSSFVSPLVSFPSLSPYFQDYSRSQKEQYLNTESLVMVLMR
jgi:hypothetical protein